MNKELQVEVDDLRHQVATMMSSSNKSVETSKSKYDEAIKKISELEIDLNVSQSELNNISAKYEALKKKSDENLIANDKQNNLNQKKIEELEERNQQLLADNQMGDVYKKKYEEMKSLRDEV